MNDPEAVSGPPPITYQSDQPKAWAHALRSASSMEVLVALCAAWGAWVPDAARAVRKMSFPEFGEFRAGLMAKTDDVHWAEAYGMIAVPGRLLEVSLVALRYGAPFGTAAIRIAELSGKNPEWAWLRKLVAA